MDIIGLEVIKNNPAPTRHIEVAPPGKLQLTYGDTFRLSVQFDYRGPARSLTLYGSLGNKGLTFDEIISNEYEFDVPDSVFEFTPCQASVNIPITSAIDAKSNYDLMAKIKEYPGETGTQVLNVIDITGVAPTFELIDEKTYPFAYIYDGDIEETVAEFKADPFTPSNWMGEQFAKKLEQGIRDHGGRPIEVKVYVDTSPLFWTDFRIEVKSTPITGTEGIGIAPIVAIIIVALAIIAIVVVVTLAIKTIAALFKHNPALEDVKPGWGKETLILTIHDSEEYWERTPTPDETLQGMSEEELREHLDKMAIEEIPPSGITWWPIAVGVGVAAVGIGVAMAMRKDGKE